MARTADSKKPATKGSLMKQTKAELVNIILRKDTVDKEKQEIIDELHKKAVTRVEYESLKENYFKEIKKGKDLTEQLDQLGVNYDKLDARNAELAKVNDDLQGVIDEDASVLCETKKKLKFWKDFAIAYILMSFLVVLLIAIM